nr:hypothetical protein CFP56_62619 [Quercus suber]
MEKNVPEPVRRIAQLQRNAKSLGTTGLLLNIGTRDPHQQHPLLQAMATVLFESSQYVTSESTVVTEC